MFSRIVRRLPQARSLYVAIFIAMLSILTLSFFIFRDYTFRVEQKRLDTVYDRLDQLQLESSVNALNTRGAEGLREYLQHIDKISGAHHFLLHADGSDVLTGENRTALLPPPPAERWRIRRLGFALAAQRSADGRYWFAAAGGRSRPILWNYLPYYLLVVGATALLCWLASVAVVSPVRGIAASISAFGRGDLSARVSSTRRDEIGRLGNSFNQMADQLQRLIVTERRLLADVSHELRSPLARLKLAVRLARTSPDSEAALDRINRDVDRITSLVTGILDVASSEVDFDNHRSEKIFIHELLDEVTRDCVVEAELVHCTIALHSSQNIDVMGNRELLRRAIENVVRNGVRYSPEGAVVDISASTDAKQVTIAVRDYGPGVPEELLARIFDPFFRAEETRSATKGGSGLGLSIARRAVLFHSGTIVAKNAFPGLCVEITIPYSGVPEHDWWNY